MTGGKATPRAITRAERELGGHLAAWRRLQGRTAAELAGSAGVSDEVLHNLETGPGRARTEGLLRVLHALGILDRVLEATDPYTTDVGRARADEVLPKRVRRSRLRDA